MLTYPQYKLLLFIHNYINDHGVSPSYEEMKNQLGLKSKSGIFSFIKSLEERGYIKKLANKARALEVVRLPRKNKLGTKTLEGEAVPKTQNIPLYGKVGIKSPKSLLTSPIKTLDIPSIMLNAGEYFALQVDGDFMIDAAICSNDIVIIARGDSAKDNDIVVALIQNSIITLNRYQARSNRIALRSENRFYEPRYYYNDDVQICGILHGALRTYSNIHI